MSRRQAGTALLEYLGAVVAVAVVVAALVALRPFEAPRRPPVDPIPRLRALVAPPPRPVRITPPARPAPPRGRPRPRPPRPAPPIVEAPGWALGR